MPYPQVREEPGRLEKRRPTSPNAGRGPVMALPGSERKAYREVGSFRATHTVSACGRIRTASTSPGGRDSPSISVAGALGL